MPVLTTWTPARSPLFAVHFAALTGPQQDLLLLQAAAPNDTAAGFIGLALGQTLEAMYGAPEYGGNQGLAGWANIGFDGDVQPQGYTPTQVSQPDPGAPPLAATHAGLLHQVAPQLAGVATPRDKQLMKVSAIRELRGRALNGRGEDMPQQANRVDLDPQLRDVYGHPVPRITHSAHPFELAASQYYGPKPRRSARLRERSAVSTSPGWHPGRAGPGQPGGRDLRRAGLHGPRHGHGADGS